jgi:hypothetical protein
MFAVRALSLSLSLSLSRSLSLSLSLSLCFSNGGHMFAIRTLLALLVHTKAQVLTQKALLGGEWEYHQHFRDLHVREPGVRTLLALLVQKCNA